MRNQGRVTWWRIPDSEKILVEEDKVGFAAETQDLIENAQRKLTRKRLALICANDVTTPDAGFGVDTNRVTILHATGEQEALPLMSKHAVAHAILHRVVLLLLSPSDESTAKRQKSP